MLLQGIWNKIVIVQSSIWKDKTAANMCKAWEFAGIFLSFFLFSFFFLHLVVFVGKVGAGGLKDLYSFSLSWTWKQKRIQLLSSAVQECQMLKLDYMQVQQAESGTRNTHPWSYPVNFESEHQVYHIFISSSLCCIYLVLWSCHCIFNNDCCICSIYSLSNEKTKKIYSWNNIYIF